MIVRVKLYKGLPQLQKERAQQQSREALPKNLPMHSV